MKKIIITSFLFLVCNSFSLAYGASKEKALKDPASFVKYWYHLHDSRAPGDKFLEVMVDKNLYMFMSKEPVQSKKSFLKWLKMARTFVISTNHTIEKLKITEQQVDLVKMDVCIKYKGTKKPSTDFQVPLNISWELARQKGQLKLRRYIVKMGCQP